MTAPTPGAVAAGAARRLRATVDRVPAAPAVLWAVTSALLAVATVRARHDLNNIDGISYISIARQYASGLFGSAVNAYWSPLISWLAAPLIALGVDGVVAIVAVSAVGASLGLAAGGALVWWATHGRSVPTLLFMATAAVFYLANVRSLTPDVLVVSWTTLFALVLARFDESLATGRHVRRHAVLLGATCTLGYVTKLFLVPVVVVVLAAWLVLRLRDRTARRQVAAAAGLAVLVAGLLAAPWAAVLSWKYGEATIGSSFAVNMSAKVDPTGGAAAREPVLWAPPNEHAISFGEDRTFQVRTGGGSDGGGQETQQLTVRDRLTYYVEQRLLAFPYYLERIRSFAPWTVPVLALATAALVLSRAGEARLRRTTLALVLTGWVYFLGYAGVTTAATQGGNARYYWPLLTLSSLAAYSALPALWQRFVAGRGLVVRTAAAILALLIPLTAAWEHGAGVRAPFSVGGKARGVTHALAASQPPDIARLAGEMRPFVPAGSAILGSNYRATLRLAYYLDARVFGRADQGYDLTDPSFRQQVRDAGIRYHLQFTPVAGADPDLTALGTPLATFTALTTCSDVAGAPIEQCRVSVREVRP
ncbi:MAG: hypothetical protein IR158_05455 [Cellulomonas sp.]|uniref:hypothetical protein n=1 Tax=Cellulomonas sp. TaxID=40001 RepID=UPI0019EDE971|nr:hypothetical protein [Cellulomonas sp.]MBF0686356.1 hypothetical protein [Cellulomonas sp.]MBF0687202.1 hypothetical protein [Cellulomonas sp.]